MLEHILGETGLYLEENSLIPQPCPFRTYQGFNVSRIEQEPIEQIQSFIAAKRLQEYNLATFGEPGVFIAFIAGIFEIMNKAGIKEVLKTYTINSAKEERKKSLFMEIGDAFGLSMKVYTTTDLWDDRRYWDCLQQLFEKRTFTYEGLVEDTWRYLRSDRSETKEQVLSRLDSFIKLKDLPEEIIHIPDFILNGYGDYPATLLYTPAEVAEAFYLKEADGVNLKLGPAKERSYDDAYIKYFMNTVHTIQPVALDSKKDEPLTVTPYIAKASQKDRLYFGDSLETVQQKMRQAQDISYMTTMDGETGIVLNPVLEKAICVAESAAHNPLCFRGITIHSGRELIGNWDVVKDTLLDVLPDLVHQNITGHYACQG